MSTFASARKNHITSSHPFVDAALKALYKAGKAGTPLPDVRLTRANKDGKPDREFYFLKIVTSVPFLKAGLLKSRFLPEVDGEVPAQIVSKQYALTDTKQSYLSDEARIAGSKARYSGTSTYDDSPAQTGAEALQRVIQQGLYCPGTIKTVQIPKFKPVGEVSPESIRALWNKRNPFPKTGKSRTLSIAPVWDRAVASSLQTALSRYLSSSWSNSVVGSRAGISIPRILGSLNQIYKTTGYTCFVCADIEHFFDAIRIPVVLDLLHKRTGYRNSSKLSDFIERVLLHGDMSKTVGLQQGNPLSPLMANLFAAGTIDQKAVNMGPYMRYVDDMLIAVPDTKNGSIAYGELQNAATADALRLHDGKSLIVDLHKKIAVHADGAVERVEGMTYLGVDIRLGQNELEFHLTDSAILKLLLNLHDALKTSKQDIAQADQEHRQYIKRKLDMILAGWFQAYGGVVWSDVQEKSVMQLLELAGADVDYYAGEGRKVCQVSWNMMFSDAFDVTWYDDHRTHHSLPSAADRIVEYGDMTESFIADCPVHDIGNDENCAA